MYKDNNLTKKLIIYMKRKKILLNVKASSGN